MIYTSYFGNIKKISDTFPNAGLISIAGKTPEWFSGEKCKLLMPHYDWWKEWHNLFKDNLEHEKSKEWYINKYTKMVLNMLEPLSIARQLKDLAKWQPTFILCYETPEKFCHRHIVADWFNKYHIPCKEWKSE